MPTSPVPVKARKKNAVRPLLMLLAAVLIGVIAAAVFWTKTVTVPSLRTRSFAAGDPAPAFHDRRRPAQNLRLPSFAGSLEQRQAQLGVDVESGQTAGRGALQFAEGSQLVSREQAF